MTIESEIYSRLSTFAGLTALVADQIYPLILPQAATLPAVVYHVISEPRISNFGRDTGDVHARIQVTCFGEKAAGQGSVLAVKEQVRLALQRFAGGNIQDCMVEGGGSSYEPETKIFTVMLDFLIWFKE